MLENLGNQLYVLVNDFGIIGFFLAAIIANATLFLPLPIDALVLLYSGTVKNVYYVITIGLVVGLGSAIGEMSGYILGYLGKKGVDKLNRSQRKIFYEAGTKLQKQGFIFIIIAAFTPIPFDAVGLAAGFLRYPAGLFFLGALIGKLARYLLIALAGYYGVHWVLSFLGAG